MEFNLQYPYMISITITSFTARPQRFYGIAQSYVHYRALSTARPQRFYGIAQLYVHY